MLINLHEVDLIKSITRADAKAVHKDLPPGGVWRTIRGHHVYIKDGKVLAGSIPGVKVKAKKATKAHLAEHQAHIDKEAKKKGTKASGKGTKSASPSKPKKTTGAGKKTSGASKGTKTPAGKATTTAPKGAKVDDTKKGSTKGKTSTTGRKRGTTAKPSSSTNASTSTGTKKPSTAKSGAKAPKSTAKGGKQGATKPATKTPVKKGTKKAVASKASEAKKTPAKKPTKAKKDIRSDVQKNRKLAYDVGDKVGGARKDNYEKMFKEKPTLDNLDNMEKESSAVAEKMVTKKNILPAHSFEAEHKNGTDLPTAILKKLLFDRMAPKPEENTPEGRKAYMNSMLQVHRQLAGIKDFEQMKNAIREMSDLARKGARVPGAQRALDRANSGTTTYTNTEYYQNQLDEGLKAKAMLDVAPLGSKFENFFTDWDSRESTLKTVRKNMKEGWDKYLAPKEKKKGAPKGTENKKWERKAEAEHLRTGGKQVNVAKPEDLIKNYGVRGVEFGHWVNDASGKYHLKRCAEAFSDLSDVIGVDPKDISLNGRLAIAFGARGKGGALAHYEPARKVINMTKHGGAGSLAHEWGHAMDNILFQYSHGGGESLGFASEVPLGDKDPKLKELYGNLMNAIRKPAPGEKGGTRQIVLDSEASSAPSRYYPRMRKQVREEGKGAEELYHEWTGAINKKYDNAIASVKENRLGFYKSEERKDKEIAKYERQRTRDTNQIGKMIAYEMQQHTGKPFKATINVSTGDSEYYSRMRQMDGSRKAYYAQGAEMFARVFESYVQDKLDKQKRYNNYLVHSTRESDVKQFEAPFPQGAERKQMFKAMDDLMSYIGKKNTLKKALILDILASGRGDMTEELRKSLDIRHDNDYPKRSAYNVANREDVIYIPLNRLKTPYQTDKATNWDKVEENVERMVAGENLEPIVIGYDYDIHDGHHRYEASHLADYTHVPCVVMQGTNDIDRQRAIEAYQEVWKSFNEADHPRDQAGKFSVVYHTTKDKNFKHDPSYRNSGQEWGSGLYTAPAKDVGYWHKALQDPSTGERHPYVVPMDISQAKLLHTHEVPEMRERQMAIMKHFGSGQTARKALEHEEKEHVTGETYGIRPHEIAEYRLYAKTQGYDGLIAHDPEEGHQVVLFDDTKVQYKPAITADAFFQKHRRGEL